VWRRTGCGGPGGGGLASEAWGVNTLIEMHEVAKALDLYKVKRSAYPTAAEGLKALVLGGELEKLPTDAWGNPIVYSIEESGHRYKLTSLGADGKEGGAGVDADIVVE